MAEKKKYPIASHFAGVRSKENVNLVANTFATVGSALGASVPGPGSVAGGVAAVAFGSLAVSNYKRASKAKDAQRAWESVDFSQEGSARKKLSASDKKKFKAEEKKKAPKLKRRSDGFGLIKPKKKVGKQSSATGKRGWSPEARVAASIARGNVNIAYGGNPNAAGMFSPDAATGMKKASR